MNHITMPGLAGTGELCPEKREAPPGSDTGSGLWNNNITGDDYTSELENIARRAVDRARLIAFGFLLSLVADKRSSAVRHTDQEVGQ